MERDENGFWRIKCCGCCYDEHLVCPTCGLEPHEHGDGEAC